MCIYWNEMVMASNPQTPDAQQTPVSWRALWHDLEKYHPEESRAVLDHMDEGGILIWRGWLWCLPAHLERRPNLADIHYHLQ